MSELELADSILRHALELQRVSAYDEARAAALFDELVRELRQMLASQDLTTAAKRDINALVKQAEEAIASRYAMIAGQVDTQRLVLVVAEKTVATLETVLATAAMPSPERLASLAKDVLIDGAPSSAWWTKQGEDLAFKFAAEVRQGVLLDETQEQIVSRIVGRGDVPGIMDAARRNVRTLVHSSVMTSANDARLAVFRKNSRLISGVRWLATLDSHTCLTCASLDGAAWDLDGNPIDGTTLDFQMPPAHFACRCVLTPIPKTFRELGLNIEEPANIGQRASKDGPVAGDTTFAAFLKRQSPAFVDEMLGKRRAELWRAGKLTLRDLVSGTGRPLTLEQLTAR